VTRGVSYDGGVQIVCMYDEATENLFVA